MKKQLFLLLFLLVNISAHAQFRYTVKAEAGFQFFLSRPIKVDPGLDWRGYQLNEEPNGIDLSVVNGVSFKENLRLGIGIGYLNYQGIYGSSVFGDLEYRTSKARFSPVFNLKIGRSHINNQYDGGSTDSFVDIGGGVEYQAAKHLALQLKGSFRIVHQTIFLPLRLGVRF